MKEQVIQKLQQNYHVLTNVILFIRLSYDSPKDLVNYQTISSKDLAKSVFDEAGWSNIVVSTLLLLLNIIK